MNRAFGLTTQQLIQILVALAKLQLSAGALALTPILSVALSTRVRDLSPSECEQIRECVEVLGIGDGGLRKALGMPPAPVVVPVPVVAPVIATVAASKVAPTVLASKVAPKNASKTAPKIAPVDAAVVAPVVAPVVVKARVPTTPWMATAEEVLTYAEEQNYSLHPQIIKRFLIVVSKLDAGCVDPRARRLAAALVPHCAELERLELESVEKACTKYGDDVVPPELMAAITKAREQLRSSHVSTSTESANSSSSIKHPIIPAETTATTTAAATTSTATTFTPSAELATKATNSSPEPPTTTESTSSEEGMISDTTSTISTTGTTSSTPTTRVPQARLATAPVEEGTEKLLPWKVQRNLDKRAKIAAAQKVAQVAAKVVDSVTVKVAEGKQSLHDVEKIAKTKAGTVALSAADAEREQWRAKVVASKKLARASKQSLRDVGKMAKTEVSNVSSGDNLATVALPREKLPSGEAGPVINEVPRINVAVPVSGAGGDSLTGDVEVEKLSKTQKRQKRKKAQRLREKEEFSSSKVGTEATEVPRVSEAELSADVKHSAVAVKGPGGDSFTGDVEVQKLSKTQKRRKARKAQKLRKSLVSPLLDTVDNVKAAGQQVNAREAGTESTVEPLNVQKAKVAAKVVKPTSKHAVGIKPEAHSPTPVRRTIELPHMVSGEEVLEYAVKHQKDPLRLAAALTLAGKVGFSGRVGLVRAWVACRQLKKPPQASLRAALSKATVMVDST
jgi:hypothetical protein